MPRVAILCFDGSYLSCIAGFMDILAVGDVHLGATEAHGTEPFACTLLSEGGGTIRASGGLPVATEPLDEAERYDVVLIPAIHYPGYARYTAFLDDLGATGAWLRDQWAHGAWIGANCTGTFVLAESGLLKGRQATTTWWLDRLFRSRYPKVDLSFRSVLTEADRLLCAGATATHMLQAIRIINVFHGPTVAAQCARTMLIDVSHTGNLPYLPLLTETTHNDALVTRAQAWLDANMSREISIVALARAMSISERSLARRFKAAIGQAPLAYLQSARLNAARALLETGDASVQTIAHRVGYSDASSFSRLFGKHFGLSPGAYRSRFQLFEGGETQIAPK